jgi:hypothetical protein
VGKELRPEETDVRRFVREVVEKFRERREWECMDDVRGIVEDVERLIKDVDDGA